MNVIESFNMAIFNIFANKTRSILTMLGIIIGIASVIAVVSLGKGGRYKITGEFEKMGATRVNVAVNRTKAQKNDYFTRRDIELIETQVDTMKYISPVIQFNGLAASDTEVKNAVLIGTNDQFDSISGYNMAFGRFFNYQEVLNSKAVAVFDEKSALALFKMKDIVGKSIVIGPEGGGKKVKIIGVRKNLQGPPREDNTIYMIIPYSFLQKLYNNNIIYTLAATAISKEYTEKMGYTIKNVVESRHKNREKDVYEVSNMLETLEQINNVLRIVTVFITAVAAISLIVGGIGVMNIMLVSVTERTREIGIRKALGATTKAIMIQFLAEACILTFIGGVMGIIVGVFISQLIGIAIDIVPIVSIKAIIGSVIFSTIIGVFFGIYPSQKAANLDPIDALRYD